MKKFLNVIYGILLGIIIPVLGFVLTVLIENEIGVLFSILLIFLIGIFLLTSDKKQIGIGIFIGLIPVMYFTFFIAEMSKLH